MACEAVKLIKKDNSKSLTHFTYLREHFSISRPGNMLKIERKGWTKGSLTREQKSMWNQNWFKSSVREGSKRNSATVAVKIPNSQHIISGQGM